MKVMVLAGGVGGAVQLGAAARADHPPDIMAGRETVGAEIAGNAEQVGELDPLVAAHAGNGGAPGGIFVGGNKVLGSRLTAVGDANSAMGAPTQADFNALVGKFNLLLDKLGTAGHGLPRSRRPRHRWW